MPAPKTREELEQTTFFKAGADARQRGQKLEKAIAALRSGTWQYDAFIAGYDEVERGKVAIPVVHLDSTDLFSRNSMPRNCACVSHDAQRCIEKRYDTDIEDDAAAELCECACHYEDEDEL